MIDRTIWFGVFDVMPAAGRPEPFAIMRANLLERKDGGVTAEIVSFHWTREDAEASAHGLNGGSFT